MQALDTTIANVALPHMQGSLGAAQDTDHLGADLLHRRRRDHDAADRLARRPLRPQAAVPGLGRRLHRGLDAVRHRHEPRRDGALPAAAGRIRRGARAAVAGGAARHQSARAARPGDGDLGRRHHGRADRRPDARRLADRQSSTGAGCSTSTCRSASSPSSACSPSCRDVPGASRGFDFFGFAMLSHRRSARCR